MKWAWREYRAARLFGDKDNMTEKAFKIRMLQDSVGIKLSDFSELGIVWPTELDLAIKP